MNTILYRCKIFQDFAYLGDTGGMFSHPKFELGVLLTPNFIDRHDYTTSHLRENFFNLPLLHLSHS